MKRVRVSDQNQWRRWLQRNHDREPTGIWLLFCKDRTSRFSLSYEEAVEEALCYGWIDSVVKRIDERWYCRKFTPRRPGSVWSKLNRVRAARVIRAGRMTEFGLAKVEEAKRAGSWEAAKRPVIRMELPEELAKALAQNPKAMRTFSRLAPSYQKHFIGWIVTARQPETKAKRVKESTALLAKGEKLGLK